MRNDLNVRLGAEAVYDSRSDLAVHSDVSPDERGSGTRPVNEWPYSYFNSYRRGEVKHRIGRSEPQDDEGHYWFCKGSRASGAAALRDWNERLGTDAAKTATVIQSVFGR